jgi:hypothetical protein
MIEKLHFLFYNLFMMTALLPYNDTIEKQSFLVKEFHFADFISRIQKKIYACEGGDGS